MRGSWIEVNGSRIESFVLDDIDSDDRKFYSEKYSILVLPTRTEKAKKFLSDLKIRRKK